MQAIVYEEYGPPDVLRLAEVQKPSPGDDEVLVRVRAVSLNGADREALIGRPLYTRIGGLRRPRHPIRGSDIAGCVEAVGKAVREFRPGDEVFGEVPGYHGGLAEYVCVPEKAISPKPSRPGPRSGQSVARMAFRSRSADAGSLYGTFGGSIQP